MRILMLKKYNIAAKKSKSAGEEILGHSLCGSMPAEKLGHVENSVDLNLHGREFSFYVVGIPFFLYLTWEDYSFSVVFATSPCYLHYREYSDVFRWSFFQHQGMSNATPPASKDLFLIVPCNSNWQWTVELLAIRLGAPLFTVSQSCSEQLKTPFSPAGGVAFAPIGVRWYLNLFQSTGNTNCCGQMQYILRGKKFTIFVDHCLRESWLPSLARVSLCLVRVGVPWVSWAVRYLDKPWWKAVLPE